MRSSTREATLHLVTNQRIASPEPINLNGFTLVGPTLARRAIPGNAMACTRALRIRRNGPALQDILEKSVRELGAIRLIDSRIGVPGQLACNPRVILGRFRTTIRFASLQIRVLLVNLRLYSIPSDIHRTSGSARSSLLLDSEHRRCWVSWCCFRSSPSDAAEHSGKKRSRTRSH